jgi:hypothetical protein
MISLRASAVLCSLVLLAGCGPVTVDRYLEREFTVDVPAGGGTAVERTRAFSLAEVEELKPQLQFVRDVTVPDIQFVVSGVSANNATTRVSGQVLVMAGEQGAPTVLADYTDLPVTEGATQALTLDVAPQRAVLAPILKGETAQVKFTGNLDAVPAQFKVKARIHVVAVVGL